MVPPFRPQRSQLHFIPKNVGGRACSCRACNVACLCGGCAMFTAFSHPLPQSHPLCTSHSGYNPSTNHLATSHIQSTLLCLPLEPSTSWEFWVLLYENSLMETLYNLLHWPKLYQIERGLSPFVQVYTAGNRFHTFQLIIQLICLPCKTIDAI